MKFAARVNSFFKSSASLADAINNISKVEGITHVDLNYSEHFLKDSIKNIQKILKNNDLKLNGIALRFRNDFVNGALGNYDEIISKKAINMCKEAIDICRELNGQVVTLWLGYDGWDYSFQIDYAKVWNRVVTAFGDICDYGKDMKISIEYKPYHPRAFSLIPDFGTTMMIINEVKKDNIGVTLDFSHMLMAKENPAFYACLASEKNKLFGLHMNDGNGLSDDGLIMASVNFIKTLELLFYLKKYKYNGVIYFDTFPVREDPLRELEMNIRIYNKLDNLIDSIGMDKIQSIIDKNDGVFAQEILFECLK